MLSSIILLLLHVLLASGTTITFPNSSSGDKLRAWNTLIKLVNDPSVLEQLYFEIAGVGDEFEDFDDVDTYDDPINRVVGALSLHDPDMAGLFPLHFALEPGFSLKTSNDNYFRLNNKKFSSPDDLFYLKSADLEAQKAVVDNEISSPGEAIIGHNANAPLIQFYGCDRVSSWESFNRNLFTESRAGKIRFVWRSTCPNDLPFQFVPSAVALTVKKSHWGESLSFSPELPVEFHSDNLNTQQVSGGQLSDLDMKVSTLICDLYEQNKDFAKTLTYMKQIVNSFPALAHELTKLPSSKRRIVEALDKTTENGIDHTMLGFYVNGQYHKLSSLDKGSVAQVVTAELTRINLLRNVLQKYAGVDDAESTVLAKKLVQAFSSRSLSTLQNSQPVKYDLHRISGFSESVIYFNDIENDPEYKGKLTDDIGEFFKQSEFGQIPAYRENWNEVIFVINLSGLESKDSMEALQGLIRAIDVVKNGHPQRIGFLPMITDPEDYGILRRIYEVKDESLNLLRGYLKELSVGAGLRSSAFDEIPPVLDILGSKLKLTNTSIIVNGEIYPFKSNLWNYIIAKVLKKDVAYIKDELRRINAAGVLTAREILHRRSFTERNLKLAPDYFEDAIYFVTNVTALNSLGTRMIELSKSDDHDLLHTITVADDFDTPVGLERLLNALKIKLLGVRIRAIHLGRELKQWNKIRKLVERLAYADIERTLSKMKPKKAANVIDHKIFSTWILELPVEKCAMSSFLTVNGKFVQFDSDEILTSSEYEMILQREALRVLDTAQSMQDVLPRTWNLAIDSDMMEMVSSIVTKMFYEGQRIYNNGIDYTAEGSISRINLDEFIDFTAYNSFQLSHEEKKVDITLIIDTLEERTQKLLTLISDYVNLDFVNLRLHLLPTKDLKIFPIHRFWLENDYSLSELEKEGVYYIDVDRPSYWHVGNLDGNNLEGEHTTLEVNAFADTSVPSKSQVEGQGNVCLQLVNEDNTIIDKTMTSKTFGYGQLRLKNLGTKFRIESCSPDFEVTSFSLDARSSYMPVNSFDFTTFSPLRAYVKLANLKKPATVSTSHSKAAIDIFSIIQDREHESKFMGLIASILNSNVDKNMKFWILMGQQPSADFSRFLVSVSMKFAKRIELEYLKYDWPRWLRPQRFREDELMAAKVLLLDFLFPETVDKIIYMDPGARIQDIEGLWSYKFDNVFCLPRAYHSLGTPYWKEGYWQNFLSKHNLKFHAIGPAFVVNLAKYRNDHTGEKFRIHYQRLSAGINFLAKVDQDLVNDMQLSVPLSTLRKSMVAQKVSPQDSDKKIIEDLIKQISSDSTESPKIEVPVIHDEL
ncbi:LAME_0B01618g1_1 [Lachancea meyersii CBS 8951]|uniref:LAME_0B01618g1_1 n=1 Tax=Lachancea meyersii CBS 8951 TaxID=1266667 RepID=A0A1G4ITT7_9SACH|nr:LAME_0B01618g1_1 [Lachancea meyersii CBS 8951]